MNDNQQQQQAQPPRPIPWLRRHADQLVIDRSPLFMDEANGQAQADPPFRKFMPSRPAPRGD